MNSDTNLTIDPRDICILIPTLNESNTIADLIDDFRSLGFFNILVIDGHSKDGTASIAKEKGATVVMQTGKGKGQAVIQAFGIIDNEYIDIVSFSSPKRNLIYKVFNSNRLKKMVSASKIPMLIFPV